MAFKLCIACNVVVSPNVFEIELQDLYLILLPPAKLLFFFIPQARNIPCSLSTFEISF